MFTFLTLAKSIFLTDRLWNKFLSNALSISERVTCCTNRGPHAYNTYAYYNGII